MGKNDTLPFEKSKKGLDELEATKCKITATELPSIDKSRVADPKWRQRYLKATSRENLEIEDEVIIDFLTHERRRRGFVRRNPAANAVLAPLNKLERLLDKNIDRIRGRPKGDRVKVVLYIQPYFAKQLDEYAADYGHKGRQEAIKWIVRDYLRNKNYTVA
jgi:hypothetical protein